jgi:hypothetical protein
MGFGKDSGSYCPILKVEIYELFKPETEQEDALPAEVLRYLDTIDDTLARHIAHAIEPTMVRTVHRAIAKMRRHYETGMRGLGISLSF